MSEPATAIAAFLFIALIVLGLAKLLQSARGDHGKD